MMVARRQESKVDLRPPEPAVTSHDPTQREQRQHKWRRKSFLAAEHGNPAPAQSANVSPWPAKPVFHFTTT
jgi:hypothetical protein